MSIAASGLSIPGVRIRGVVTSLPSQRIDSDQFTDRFGVAGVADTVKLIGVQTRYGAPDGQTTLDLCQAAGERLLARLGWDPETVDALVLVTQTPEYRSPPTACLLQTRLGLPTRAQAFDVVLGCSGYVYGLWIAYAMVRAGLGRVLLLAGDTLQPILDPGDRGTALLFGDAGSATAVEADPSAGPAVFELGTDGRGARHLITRGWGFRATPMEQIGPDGKDPSKLFMDGAEVLSFTLKSVPPLVQRTLALAGWTVADLDALVLHQASRFMLQHLGKKIGIPPERLPINIDRYGNTGPVTIPLVLADDLAPRLLSQGGRLCLAGFGIGWSWGCMCLDQAPMACAETLFL